MDSFKSSLVRIFFKTTALDMYWMLAPNKIEQFFSKFLLLWPKAKNPLLPWPLHCFKTLAYTQHGKGSILFSSSRLSVSEARDKIRRNWISHENWHFKLCKLKPLLFLLWYFEGGSWIHGEKISVNPRRTILILAHINSPSLVVVRFTAWSRQLEHKPGEQKIS